MAIANPFAVARYELTFDEWDACAAHGYCAPFVNDNGWGRGLLISMDNRANERTEPREVSYRQLESHGPDEAKASIQGMLDKFLVDEGPLKPVETETPPPLIDPGPVAPYVPVKN